MVNTSTTKAIIDLLHNTERPLSGNDIAKAIGISRVAVWKQVQKLMKLGMNICSSSKGYEIRGNDAWGTLSRNPSTGSIHFNEVSRSTMVDARNNNNPGNGTLDIYIAGKQTNGLGTSSREWESPEGGLYSTITMGRMRIPALYSQLVTIAIVTAAAKALKASCGVEAATKWPNDIYVNDMKIGGVLTTCRTSGTSMLSASTGIGLNVNNDPPENIKECCSIKSLGGQKGDPPQILEYIISCFHRLISDFHPAHIIAEWESMTCMKDRAIKVNSRDTTIAGRFSHLDPYGSLVISTNSGKECIANGDCLLL